jgi:cysteinyl-tRNA synthetase
MIKLNNSLNPNSKDLTELVKHPDKPITMYSCGPTTYDHAHIGNLRSFIMDDLLRRTIVATYGRESLNAIMNITDIDDKTIHRSIEEYPELAKTDPKAALKKLTDKYEKLFFDDLEAVGVDRSLFTVVRATEQLPQMQEMIKQIHANGFAYISDGSVYFDVAAYIKAGNKYGLLAHIDPSHQKSRIDNDEYEKQEAQDFVLWKGERDNEPAWDFKLDGQNLPGSTSTLAVST